MALLNVGVFLLLFQLDNGGDSFLSNDDVSTSMWTDCDAAEKDVQTSVFMIVVE